MHRKNVKWRGKGKKRCDSIHLQQKQLHVVFICNMQSPKSFSLNMSFEKIKKLKGLDSPLKRSSKSRGYGEKDLKSKVEFKLPKLFILKQKHKFKSLKV